MAGPQSELSLLQKMGVDAHLTQGVNWSNVASSASSGNPVILNTPGHYLYVDGYNSQTGEYHVGASGLALRGGSDWMTPQQIAQVPGTQGAANAAIFVDHPIDGTQQQPPAQAAAIPTGPTPNQPGDLIDQTRRAAIAAGINPDLFARQIQAESNFNPNAQSQAGARGIAQFTTDTAHGLGIDPMHPNEALPAAANLMRSYLDRFGGDWASALSAYNAGPGRVPQGGGVPDIAETRGYVTKVLGNTSSLQDPTYAIHDVLQPVGQAVQGAIGAVGSALGGAAQAVQQLPQQAQNLVNQGWQIVSGAGGAADQALQNTYQQAQQGIQNLTQGLTQTEQQAQQTISDTAQQAQQGIQDLLQGLGQTAQQASSQAQQTVQDLAQNVPTIDLRTPAERAQELAGQLPQAVGNLIGGYTAPTAAPTEPAFPGGQSALGYAVDQLAQNLPDLGDVLQTPPADTPLGRVVRGESIGNLNPLDQLQALMQWNQQYSQASEQATQRINPARDVPLLGGIINQATNPENYLALAAGAGPAGFAREALGGVRGTLAAGGIEGAILNAVNAAQQPSATAQDIAVAGALGLPLGAATAGLGEYALPATARVLGEALQSPAVREFLTSESGALRVGGAAEEGDALRRLPEEAQTAYATTGQSLEQAAAQAAADVARLQRLRETLPTETTPQFDQAGNPVNQAAQDWIRTEEARAVAGRPVTEQLATAPLPEGARPITLTPEEQVARLNLEQFPENVRQQIADAAQGIDFANQQRRGVIPDAVANNLARELANSTSLTDVINQVKPGDAFNTEQLRAIRNAVGAQGAKVADLAAAISGGDNSTESLAQFLSEGDRLQALVQIAEGGRAEAGRAMRAFMEQPSLINLAPDQAAAEIARRTGGNPEQLISGIANYQALLNSGADPIQLASFWNGFKAPPVTGFDWFKALRYNSMISGAPTIERIGISGALENLYAAAREGGLALAQGRPDEASAIAKGGWLGFLKGGQNAAQTLVHGINEEQALAGGFPRGIAERVSGPMATGPFRGPVARAAALALEAPGRIHSAIQDITQGTAYGMRMYQRAAQQADAEGLSGQAAAARIAQLVREAPLNPRGQAMMRDATAFSQRAAMRGELGKFGSSLLNLAQRGGPLGHLVLPFARVAYNVGARGIDRSPLGLIGTLADVARTGGRYAGTTRQEQVNRLTQLQGVRPFRERLVDNLVGSLLTGGALWQANQGNVTGSGPADVNRRNELEAQGWQPYSLRVGGNYVPYRLLGPWAVPLALGASAAEAHTYAKTGQQLDDPWSMAGDAARRAGEFAANETYLRDIGNIMRGVSQPDRYGNSFISDLAGSLVPYGALGANINQALSPVQRQVRTAGTPLGQSIAQTIESRIPGLAGQVPVRTDVLGRAVPRAPGAGWAPEAVSPARADPVLRELATHGLTVPVQDKYATSHSGTAEVQLTPNEQRTVQARSGYLIQQNVRSVMSEPAYANASRQEQEQMLSRAVSVGHQQANQEMVASVPESRLQAARHVTITIPATERQPLPVP